ncbi:MAG: cytochrome c biogenesis protein CcdA [Alphaproteobacteria bacterium]
MDFTYPTALLIPLALGLLGFVEPCAVGGHLIFLRTLVERSLPARLLATLTFTLARTLMMGAFGALAALLGQHLIRAQTGFWLVFGSLYLLIGAAYAFGRADIVKRRLDVAPTTWKATRSPLVLGMAFGLSIPACAAPILFALIGLSAGGGAAALGFATMAAFGLALSAPLVLLVVSPGASALAARLMRGRPATRWTFAALFLALGAWSIWFGLFVDPADWSRL